MLLKSTKKTHKQTYPAFTIVELLVVIVVIAILATITIVSYSGIRQKALAASLQSDLKNASTQLEIYKTEHEVYPTSVTDCPTPSDGNICITTSGDNTITSYTVDNAATPPTYSLGITNSSASLAYKIDQDNTISEAVSGWKSVSVGNSFVCAISLNDLAYCWGYNSYGQLGNNSTTNSSVPVAVDASGVLSGKTIKAISAGTSHVCAIASDNQAYCWGWNALGQLGNNSTTNSSVPVAVDTSGVLSGKTIIGIASGGVHTCVIASDNQAYCWGGNYDGQLGDNSTTQSDTPVAVYTSGVLAGKTTKSISAYSFSTCVIASDNQAYCWGGNYDGQLGDNSTTSSPIPVAVYTSGVLSGKTILLITAGGGHVCTIASDNLAYCWGSNSGTYGEIGDGSGISTPIPVDVDTSGTLSGKTVKYIASYCLVASDYNAYCWGDNNYGQLGNNSTTGSHSPVAVYKSGALNNKTVKSIASYYGDACVIASDNQIYCWGRNNYGQLGINSTSNSLVPVQVVNP